MWGRERINELQTTQQPEQNGRSTEVGKQKFSRFVQGNDRGKGPTPESLKGQVHNPEFTV